MGTFFKMLQSHSRLTKYNQVTTFEKPAAMEGMGECDSQDQISLQRAEATMNVSRGEEKADDAPSESGGWIEDNSNSGINNKDYGD